MPSLLDSIKAAGDKALGTLGIDPIFGEDENLEGAYFGGSQLAHRMFGQNEIFSNGNSPYLGFQYFVKINFNSIAKEDVAFYTNYLQPGIDFAPIIQNIDMPGMSVSTDKLNEYNRWRISQTKIEFEPIKMTLFDSVNGGGLGLWKAYYHYYFKDSITPENVMTTNPTPVSFNKEHDIGSGYFLENVENDRYLITSIDIYQLHQNKYTQTRIHNPRISDFSHGGLAYENSDAIKLDFTFEYENVTYMPGGYVLESETPDIYNHLANSNVPTSENIYADELARQKNPGAFEDVGVPEEQSLLDDIKNIKDPESALAALKRAKSESQEVLGAYAQMGAQFNQLQMDLTGKDEPIIKAPSVRNVSAVVNTVPTGYSDIRRSARKIQGD